MNKQDREIKSNEEKQQDGQSEKSVTPQKKKRILLWAIVATACIVVVLLCVFQLGKAEEERRRIEQTRQLAEQPGISSSSQPPSKTEEAQASASLDFSAKKTIDYRKTKKPNEREIDFEELKRQNQDVVAWLEVPGTQIDYPFVTTTDNDYYLSHDLQKKESEHGAVYMDVACDINFADPVTILYGHNMKDGTMFADLHLFSDPEFIKKNPIIKLYTPDGQMDFRVIAAYKNDDFHLLNGRNLRNPTVYQDYLDEIKAKQGDGAYIDMDHVTINDSLLVLSTCVRGEDENRFVVQAVFVPPETTA